MGSDDDSLFEGSKEKSEKKKTRVAKIEEDYIASAIKLMQKEKAETRYSNFEKVLYEMPAEELKEKVRVSRPPAEDTDLSVLPTLLIPKVVDPGADQRSQFAELDAWSVMYSMIKQGSHEFREGILVH